MSGANFDLPIMEKLNAAPVGNISYEDLKDAIDEALAHKGGEIMPTIAGTLIERGMQHRGI